MLIYFSLLSGKGFRKVHVDQVGDPQGRPGLGRGPHGFRGWAAQARKPPSGSGQRPLRVRLTWSLSGAGKPQITKNQGET